MRVLLTCILIFFSTVCYSVDADQLSAISLQYANRNWGTHSFLYAKRARLIEFTNIKSLNAIKKSLESFAKVISTADDELIELFFPESDDLASYNQRILYKEKLERSVAGYETLLNWKTFLDAIGTERWGDQDVDGCDISSNPSMNPLLNPLCGRNTRGNYAISQLTYEQRLNLSLFKQVMLEELDMVSEMGAKVPVGPEIARVFQFITDSRSIDKLIQTGYLLSEDENDPTLHMQNRIEIARALIIQLFKTANGEISNSNLIEISLEDPSCFSHVGQNLNCQFSYIKDLVWNRNSSNILVSNLIFDPKAIKPFLDSMVLKFSNENPESLSRSQMEEFLQRSYFSLCLAYDLNPESIIANQEERQKFIKVLKQGSEYLINRRHIIGLQTARGMHELIIYLETL